MRRGKLDEFVEDLVRKQWTGDDADVANVVLEDEKFGVLPWTLNDITDGGDEDAITVAFEATANALTDNDLDWMTGELDSGAYAENPATFLAAKARGVH